MKNNQEAQKTKRMKKFFTWKLGFQVERVLAKLFYSGSIYSGFTADFFNFETLYNHQQYFL